MVMFVAQLPLWARAVCFKLGWLALVIGQAKAIVPVLLVWLLVVGGFSASRRKKLVLLCAGGVLLDALAVSAGVLQFQRATHLLGLPLYYVMLWGWFGTCWLWCFVHWFGRGGWLCGFTLAMPLAYIGGSRLGADLHIDSWLVCLLLPAWWALLRGANTSPSDDLDRDLSKGESQ